MTRRCSHCSNNGHNSRTCPARGGGVRLFGVRLTEGVAAMKKSASMGCLPSSSTSAAACTASSSPAAGAAASPYGDPLVDHHHSASAASGYASDDPARASCSSNCRSERKKGVPWTEDEHRMFLMGLQKLGKGDWRGIARNFVVSRTPTQVASHAQKYFIRQSNASRRKRRSSLFDMVPEMPIDHGPPHEEQLLPNSPIEVETTNKLPALHLGLQGPKPIEPSTTEHVVEPRESIPHENHPVMMLPMFYPTFIPVPVPFLPSDLAATAKDDTMGEAHEVVKPTPVVRKEPVNMDEVISMSKLRIGEGVARSIEPSALSFKLLGSSSASRQSAFHINPSIAMPDLNQSSGSPIHAV
ncbi:transcription factor MYBS3-like isoform X1 [Musa acuminata AAA Group]|uniref:transcription factor MYBS3-like isoform X1 n=1 Tax=Musa acuminata AAA Group TaxID=214697 RepID=UPI0031DE8EA8